MPAEVALTSRSQLPGTGGIDAPDKAREALETALRNDPAYTTARENLGDIYVRLAIQAYERAGTSTPELQRKLQLARQMLVRTPRGS